MKQCLMLMLLAATVASAETIRSDKQSFRVETIVSGLENPWGVAKLPDGRFLITERPGRLVLLDAPGATPRQIEGVPAVFARGQGGLLDVAVHPDYDKNGWVYLAFAKPIGSGAHTAIIRGRLDGDRLTDIEPVYEPPADQATERAIHFGCRLVFDGRGHLFFSIGDRGGPTNPENPAQDLSQAAGKIHRVRDDGSIPPDNPFVGRKNALPTIWAYGTRNAQGMVYDTSTGRLWETEHGPRGGDELNIIRKGANYGWPLATFGINYSGTTISDKTSLPGMENPVVQWTPVIAASGLAIYHGDKFPRWKGDLFAGGLAGQRVQRLELNGASVSCQETLLEGSGRIRDVRVFDDGFLYVLYDAPGQLVRMVPAE